MASASEGAAAAPARDQADALVAVMEPADLEERRWIRPREGGWTIRGMGTVVLQRLMRTRAVL